MTRDEVKMLLVTMSYKFDTFAEKFSKWTPVQQGLCIDSWFEDLAPYSFEDVKRAMAAYRDTSNTAFAPSTSQIIGLMRSLNTHEVNSTDAWILVHKAICSNRDEMEETFAKLPAPIQRAVGSPRMLREWSMLDSEEIHNSIHPRFLRSYEAAVKETTMKPYMAPEIRKALEEKVYKYIPQIENTGEKVCGISEETERELNEYLGGHNETY